MRLTKEEAIALVLSFSKKQEISSPTKLNKLLARLNLHFIPIDIDFSLNKYGSFNANLGALETTPFYHREMYKYKDREVFKFILKEEGRKLAENATHKIKRILKPIEIKELQEEISSLSELQAGQISDDEHKKLFLDVDDRHKLIERINTVHVDMYDLYQEMDKINQNKIEEINLAALIEYCFHLSKYLKEKRFKNIEDTGYDFDAYMLDYYFLYGLEIVVPVLREQLKQKEKDQIVINKYYQYFINSARGKYPFSLDNGNLNKLAA